MLGAIIGDVIGSVFEWHNVKTTDFNLYSRFTRFTDDTVMTVAVADAVLIRQKEKNVIKDYFASKRLYDDIRPNYTFDPSCQGSVPQAIIAFLESENFEDAIRKAISLGGDSDTIACISGGIAQAYYKEIPGDLVSEVMLKLDSRFRSVICEFNAKYGIHI